MAEENKNFEQQKKKTSWTLLRKIGTGILLFCIITAGFSFWELEEGQGNSGGIGIPCLLFLIFVDAPLFGLGIILILADLFQKAIKKEKEFEKKLEKETKSKITKSKVKRIFLILLILFLVWLISGIFSFPSFFLYQSALNTKNSFFCFLCPLTSGWRYECYLDLAIEKKDLSLCDKSLSQNYCYREVAKLKKESILCEKISDSFNRDSCYLGVAEARKEVDLCEKISDLKAKNFCFYAIAEATKNPNLCEKIRSNHRRERCYKDMGIPSSQ